MFDKNRLEKLLHRYFDQVLTPEELQELELLLSVSDKARQFFWSEAGLHGLMCKYGRRLTGDQMSALTHSTPIDERSESKLFKSIRNVVWPLPFRNWAWVTAGAASIALLLVFFQPAKIKLPNNGELTSTTIALLRDAVGVQWNEKTEAHTIGECLKPGALKWNKGSLYIDFYTGARIRVEGPAELELVSTKEAICRAGKLTAEVPPQARGFKVCSPEMDIVDLGTEFGMDVKPGSMEVHVLKGEIELHDAIFKKGNLKQGQTAFIKKGGTVIQLAASSTTFTSVLDADRQSRLFWQTRQNTWLSDSTRLNTDPSLLVRFIFESNQSGSFGVDNVAAHAGLESNGVLVGCNTAEGRWLGKAAIEFNGVSDRIRLKVPGEFTNVTMTTWVRVSSIDRDLNSIFMCDDFMPGAMHWQITRNGSIRLGIYPPDSSFAHCCDFDTATNLFQPFLGQWVNMAVVMDGIKGEVCHYINGKQVARNEMSFKETIRLNLAELGNWNPGHWNAGDTNGYKVRNLTGLMDEFTFYSRALSNMEILSLYETGCPTIPALDLAMH